MPDELMEKAVAGAMLLASGLPTDHLQPANPQNTASQDKSIVAEVGKLPSKPNLVTPQGNRIVLPNISFDGASSIENPNQVNKIKAMDWLAADDPTESGYNQIDAVHPQEKMHRRDCLPMGQFIVGCLSDFGHDPEGISGTVAKLGQFDEKAGDGSDIIKVDEDWVSIVATQDLTGGKQLFVSENCKIGDGWVLFPTSFVDNLHDGKKGSAIVPIRQVFIKPDGTYDCPPADSYDKTLTDWEYKENGEFKSGTFQTIRVRHYHTADKDNPYGYEEFWFTKEYGLTKWASVRKNTEGKDKVFVEFDWSLREKNPNFSDNKNWPWAFTEIQK